MEDVAGTEVRFGEPWMGRSGCLSYIRWDIIAGPVSSVKFWDAQNPRSVLAAISLACEV